MKHFDTKLRAAAVQALNALSDEQIGHVLGLSRSTVLRIKQSPEFAALSAEALDRWQTLSEAAVSLQLRILAAVNSLLDRVNFADIPLSDGLRVLQVLKSFCNISITEAVNDKRKN